MKKNSFLTFLFSLIPGCGLMYLGYMKKGLQIMAMFAASIYLAIASVTGSYGYRRFEWIMLFFVLLMPIIWFYQMFDAMHSLARMRRLSMDSAMDDAFFLPKKIDIFSPAKNPAAAKVLAAILIGAGVIGLFSAVWGSISRYIIPQVTWFVDIYLIPSVISLALIVIGVRLLKGRKGKKSGNYADRYYDGEGEE